MTTLTNADKKELARLTYIAGGLTQKEIAQKVKASEPTISKWIREGHWDKHRISLTLTREEQLRRLYSQIAEYNDAIEAREAGKRFATSKEADAINKLATAIEKMERDISAQDILNVSKKMLDWLRSFDLPKAQELSGMFDAFLKDNLR